MTRSRSQVGRRSREYGKEFEREVVRRFRKRFADRSWAAGVRRSDQSHRAALSDVTGVPGLWVECEAGGSEGPVRKLEQAVRDLGDNPGDLIPVAVTRRKGSPRVRVTLAAFDVCRLMVGEDVRQICETDPGVWPVEMALEDFLDLYDESGLGC